MEPTLPPTTAVSFRSYLRQWFRAAIAPTYDIVGVVAFVVGCALWAWNKFFPTSLQAAARGLGVTEVAAMSDLVWEIPLIVGVLVLLYRLIRAPYEIHVALESHVLKLDREFPFAVSVPELFTTPRSIQLRLLVLNRQEHARLALALKLGVRFIDKATLWISQAELQGFELGVGSHQMSDGIVVFRLQEDGREVEELQLFVMDMVSQRSVGFEVPGKFPPSVTLTALSPSTFGKGPNEIGTYTGVH